MSPRGGAPLVGAAGAVVRQLLTPLGLGRSLPAIFGAEVLGLCGLYLAQEVLALPAPGTALAVLAVWAPLLGAQSLGQRYGGGRVGPVAGGDVLRFGARWLALAAAWTAPVVLASQQLWPLVSASPSALVPQAWWPLSGALVLALVGVVSFYVSLLLATGCDTMAALLSPRAWRRNVGRHLPDLAPGLALILGGSLLAAALLVPAAHAVAQGFLHMAPGQGRLAIIVVLAGYLSPVAVAVVLAARVAGTAARLQDERDAEEDLAAAALERPTSIPLTIAPGAAAARSAPPVHLDAPGSQAAALIQTRGQTPAVRLDAPGFEAVAFIHAFQALAKRAETDLPGAIADGEALLAKQPRAAGVLAELARLYRRAARDADAFGAASRAINLAVLGGMGPVAVQVYDDFREARAELALDRQARAMLGAMLRAQGRVEDAAWCLAEP